MANRIKGITIEIGGDTTKLDKALSGTNKTIRETQKQLKDVERLLKLDPGNTELLQQKQRLLAESVEATAEKLDTLRRAADNADKALQKGKDYQAAYEPLKTELDSVTASMRALEANAESMQQQLSSGRISQSQYDAFASKLNETRQRAESLEQAIKDVNRQFSGRIDQSQYDALQREIIETENALKDLEDQADQSSVSLGKINAAAGSISEGAGKLSSAMQPVTTAILGISAAAVATVPATEELRISLATLETNATRAGVGMDAAQQAFQRLNTVSGETDSSLEAVSNLLQAGFTESNLQRAVEGLANAAITFPDTIKIESLADSLQETLATGEATGQFGELLDRLGLGAEAFSEGLAMCTTEAEKQSYAINVLTTGPLSDAYNAWAANNEELISNRDSALEFQTALAKLAEQILPLITFVTELATQFVNWFTSLDEGGQKAIVIIGLFIAAIGPLSGIISAIGTAASVSGIAFSKWAIIIMGVVLALAALAAIIAVITGKTDEMENAISDAVSPASNLGNTNIPRGRSAAYSGVPAFANGGLVPPNDPFLAVLGDNTREAEVVAPYSTIKQAAGEAIAENGGNGGVSRVEIVVRAKDGFTRNLSYSLSEESRRRGVRLVNG